jgi:hypothetical protein
MVQMRSINLDRRAFIAASAAAAAFPSAVRAQAGPIFRPEHFGGKGDGIANDTAAFAALGAEVSKRGGGTIALRAGATYLVGEQHRGGDYGWTPSPVLELRHLSRPLRILGNGARMRCAPGLRYGAFDLTSGEPVHHPMPNLRIKEIASPYRSMIHAAGCSGPVEIRDVELDGNVQRLRIGGQYGDGGWQIPAIGILLEENSGPELIDNVLTHHHAQDGALIIGAAARTGRGRINRLVSRYNARQGLSLTAGRGYDFADCEFSHTGRSTIHSPPGAGVDIEAETRPIRDLTFARCKFVDNEGVGMVADSGDSAGARFRECLFVGTSTWSAWPHKPEFRFEGCTFVGSVVHPFPDADPAKACRFTNCRFTDDPKLSPTGKVFVGGGPIVNLATSDNVLFDRCNFALVAAGVLPWSWKAIYRDCTMSQRSPVTAMTKGRFLGRNVVHGPVDFYGDMVEGDLVVNGKRIARGPHGGAPW